MTETNERIKIATIMLTLYAVDNPEIIIETAKKIGIDPVEVLGWLISRAICQINSEASETPISKLRLSTRVKTALKYCKSPKLVAGDLLDEKELAYTRGMGVKCILEIREKLEEIGLKTSNRPKLYRLDRI